MGSHPPQSRHLLFYIQACSNFSVTSHGNVVRDRNIHYKSNAFFKSIENKRFYSTLLVLLLVTTEAPDIAGNEDVRGKT
jgi:hypothetical protein